MNDLERASPESRDFADTRHFRPKSHDFGNQRVTMNGQFDEELLSAYHDGELPEPERRPVADRIADDSGLREVLDEYAELSSSLQSLPRSQAPEELHSAVMGRLRDSAAVRRSSAQARPSRRKLWIATVGTAASLLLAVGLLVVFNGPPGGPGADVANMINDSEALPPAAGSMAADERAEGGGFGGGAFPMAAADALPSDQIEIARDSRALNAQLRELLTLDDLDVGQQLHVLRSVGDDLVLIEFQVVDVDDAFGEVQVLLDELQVTKLDGEAGVVGESVAGDDRLRAILLDASHETMLAALDRIDELESVVLVDTNGADMALELGVEPDRIPQRLQQAQSMALSAPGEEPAPPEADTAPSPSAGQSRASTPPDDRDRPDAMIADARQAESQDESAEAAYQVPLSLPGDVVREIEVQVQQQYGQQAAGAANEGPSRGDDPERAVESAADTGGDRPRSRVLLIFIAREPARAPGDR